MKKIVKKIALTASVTLPLLFSMTTANAKFVNNDSQNLTQCRALVAERVGAVDRIKVGNIRSRSGSFSAKFKISNDGERSVFVCELAKNQVAAVSCLKGAACNAADTASTKN